MRKAAGLAQIELARKVGISRVRLSLAECDHLTLRPEEVDAIKEAAINEAEKNAARLRG